jgi:flagellar hook-associated protein 2
MTSITSAGVGSGLDLEAIISVTLDAEDTPKQAQFEKRESSLDIQLTALGQIKSDLSSLEDNIDALNDINNFNKLTADVTQPTGGDVISVSADSTATAGNYNIEVVQLAQGSRAVQDDANAYSSVSDIVTTTGGILTFTAGTKTFDVTLGANATLEDLRTAINDAADNFGVSANIINTGGATPLSKLVFTSDETGDGKDLVVTNNNAELDRVSTTANAGGAGGMVIAATDIAKNAIIKIDNIQVQSESNIFINAIQDTTITALKVDTNPAKLEVATDKASVKETLESFVKNFNSLMETLDTAVTSRVTGGTARGLRNTLINQLNTAMDSNTNVKTIFDAGVQLTKEGRLEIKSTSYSSLDDALNESYDEIGTLFAGTNGLGSVLKETADLYLKSGGILKVQTDSVDIQKKDLEQDKSNHEYRMELLEKRLRSQYTSLDVLVAQLRAQGNSALAALSNLPGFTSGSKS